MAAELPKSYEELVNNYRTNTPIGNVFGGRSIDVEKWTRKEGDGAAVWIKLIKNREQWEACRPALKKLGAFLIPWREFEHEGELYYAMAGGAKTVHSIFQASDLPMDPFMAEALSFGLEFLCACLKEGVMYVDIKPPNMVCSEAHGFRMIDLDSFVRIDEITVKDLENPAIIPATIYGIYNDFYRYSTLFDHALFHLLYTFVNLYIGDDDVFEGVECATLFKPDGGGTPVGFGNRMILCKNDAYDGDHPFYKAIERGNFKQTNFTELIVRIYKANMAQARAATEAIKAGKIPDPERARDACALTS